MSSIVATGLYSSAATGHQQSVVEFVEEVNPIGLKPLWALLDVGDTAVDISLVDELLWIFRKDGVEVRKPSDGQVLAYDSFDDVATIVSGCVISGQVAHNSHAHSHLVKGM
eukprot:1416000-Amphidinium_carterae.1